MRTRLSKITGGTGGRSLRVFALLLTVTLPLQAAEKVSLVPSMDMLQFRAQDDGSFQFNTGVVKGVLRPEGRSVGLSSVVHVETGVRLDQGHGLLSLYRAFSAGKRYGTAVWDVPSAARLSASGGVEVYWANESQRPFELWTIYQWTLPGVLDLTTVVRAHADLPGFELFLANYFAEPFTNAMVYVSAHPDTNDKAALLPAKHSYGDWQMFPRDPQVASLIKDGRWSQPPNPVEWTLMPQLKAPVALRREFSKKVVALFTAPETDCFAIATPYQEEGHRSIYLSLFGRDLKPGDSALARTRLRVAAGASDEAVIRASEAYLGELRSQH